MSDQEFIPLSVPSLGGNALAYVSECIETEWVSYVGSYVFKFEENLAKQSGAPHVAAMNSGTSALHIALILAGVGLDDEVIMPAITFVSPANAVRYCGAWPVFVDLSEADWQMDVAQVELFLSQRCERRSEGLFNSVTGRRVAALLPVHLLGGMADVDALAELAEAYGLPLIEDAAEALGATYKGRKMAEPLPNHPELRRFVCTSFNGNKIITTGGGGALFSYNREDAQRAKHLSTTAKTDPIEFVHDEVGFNYRLTNTAAALGCSQLEQLELHVSAKRAIAQRYNEAFRESEEVALMPHSARCDSSFWLYTIQLKKAEVLPFIQALGEHGVQARPLWKPMHQLPFLAECDHLSCEFGENIQRRAVSIPCSVGLTEQDQMRVIKVINEYQSA